MNELLISTFIKIVQSYLIKHNSQEEAGRFILESITNQPNSYCSTDLNSKKISRLVSRKDPVPDDIKQAATRIDIVDSVREYFDTKIMNDLNPVMLPDLVDAFYKIINLDLKIGTAKKEELKNHYKTGQNSKFLSEIFIYSIFRDNKKLSGEVSYQDIPFLDEVNYECPLTQEKLIENIKGVSMRRYTITEIFPRTLSEEDKRSFESVKRCPDSYDDPSNLIALSERASENYLINPTLDEYRELCEIKNILSRRYDAKRTINRLQLEDDIRDVISSLINLPKTGIVQLEYEALRIEDKIKNNPLLKNEIQRQVVEYYRFIENVFKDLDCDFDLIASEIKVSSLKLEKAGIPEEEIISSLASWIHSKSNLGSKGITACNIIVSFFIQNCEVFSDEAS